MIEARRAQRSFGDGLIAAEVTDLREAWMTQVDALLADDAIVAAVYEALARRHPQSRRRGRRGTPAEVVLRMLLLKHLYRWSYDTLEYEVRTNLVYRAFARVGSDAVPDAKTILKIARVLGPDVIQQLHARVVQLAVARRVTRGRRLRVDTTVVETDVHYPTDSTLLRDGVRVLTRTMQRANAALGDPRGRVRNRLRSVGRRVLEIGRQARSPETRDALVRSYRKLMATTRAVMRDAKTMVRRIGQRLRTASAATATSLTRAHQQLQQLQPVVERVLEQTRARIVGGDTHVADKVLSIFEPHTEAIRKGKIAKPTEFGKLVTIQESEHQIITCAPQILQSGPARARSAVSLWQLIKSARTHTGYHVAPLPFMAFYDPPPSMRCRHACPPCADASSPAGGGELVSPEAAGALPRALRQAETAGSGDASHPRPALTAAGVAPTPDGGPARHAYQVASSGLAASLAREVAARTAADSERLAATHREHGPGEPDLG
jgi:IS5 family transposase